MNRHQSTGRTYYVDLGVQVTGRSILTPQGRFRVGDLARLRTARSRRHPMARAAFPMAAGLLAAIAILVPLAQRQPALWLCLVGTVAVPVGLALAVRARSSHQLWAEYRGRTVLVFASQDEKTFGHVCRALIRARESQPPYGEDRPGLRPLRAA